MTSSPLNTARFDSCQGHIITFWHFRSFSVIPCNSKYLRAFSVYLTSIILGIFWYLWVSALRIITHETTHMATFRKVKNGIRAEVYVKGKRASKILENKTKAKDWALEKELELKNDAGIAQNKTVYDLFERYRDEITPSKKSADKETHRLNAFLSLDWSTLKLSEVKPAHIAAWRDRRLKQVSPGSVIRELNIIRHAFEIATREWNWIATNPTKGVKAPKQPPARDRLITDDEIDAMCLSLGLLSDKAETISQRVAAAFLFAIETAMRQGEICKLTEADIKGNVAQLRDTKNGADRDVALSTRALEILAMLPDGAFNLKESQIDANFRKARTRAGLSGFTFHDSRHNAIVRLSKKLNVLELARMVGHKNINQLMTYYSESASNIAKKLDR